MTYLRVPLIVGETPGLGAFDTICEVLRKQMHLDATGAAKKSKVVDPQASPGPEQAAGDVNIVFNCQR